MSEAGAMLAEGLKRYELTPAQLAQFELVLEALERDEHAPTAVRTGREATERHLADSLVGLDFNYLIAADAIADLGAGAGFPGVALAIALPKARISLVESQRRKCEFLERLCTTTKVANASVVVRARSSGRLV